MKSINGFKNWSTGLSFNYKVFHENTLSKTA